MNSQRYKKFFTCTFQKTSKQKDFAKRGKIFLYIESYAYICKPL